MVDLSPRISVGGPDSEGSDELLEAFGIEIMTLRMIGLYLKRHLHLLQAHVAFQHSFNGAFTLDGVCVWHSSQTYWCVIPASSEPCWFSATFHRTLGLCCMQSSY